MPNWKKVVVSGSDATLNSISSSLGIYSAGNITAPNFIGTASRATSASIADSIRITNDANNRIITSNGNNTLNAEETLTYDGSQLSFDAATRISINSYRLFDVTKNSNDVTIALGDLSNAFNATELRVDDGAQKIELFFSSSKGSGMLSHYFNNIGLFVTGAITASELYIDNRDLSPAFFGGAVDVTGRLTAGIGDFNELTGNWLSSNGANRVITSDGDGTFTAESGLTYTPNTLNVNGSVIATGDITTYGNLIAKQFIVSSSVSYFTESFSSGSTKFGDSSDDTHQFTGSLLVTGSITGTTLLVSGNKITDSTIINSPVIKFANLPENLNGEMEGVVVWDSTQGQLYWTSSLGSGFTTAHNLQQVTTAGSSTTIPITASIISASDSIFTSQSHTTTLSFKAPLTSTSSFEILSIPTNHHSVKGVIRESLTLDSNAYGRFDLFKVSQSISYIEINPTFIYKAETSPPFIISFQIKITPEREAFTAGTLINNAFQYNVSNLSFSPNPSILGQTDFNTFTQRHNLISGGFWDINYTSTFMEVSFVRDSVNSFAGNLANSLLNTIIPYEIYQF